MLPMKSCNSMESLVWEQNHLIEIILTRFICFVFLNYYSIPGLPHERQFTIVCTLLKRREVGTGKSKKLAKRQAAYKMWQALKDNPPESFQNEEEVILASYFLWFCPSGCFLNRLCSASVANFIEIHLAVLVILSNIIPCIWTLAFILVKCNLLYQLFIFKPSCPYIFLIWSELNINGTLVALKVLSL